MFLLGFACNDYSVDFLLQDAGFVSMTCLNFLKAQVSKIDGVGKTKAKQYYVNDVNITQMRVSLDGDGSFAGRCVVYETWHLSVPPKYTTDGTNYIVVSTQVGFTMDPRGGRSSQYYTDIEKVLNSPIFLDNGDDDEAVAMCVKVLQNGTRNSTQMSWVIFFVIVDFSSCTSHTSVIGAVMSLSISIEQ